MNNTSNQLIQNNTQNVQDIQVLHNDVQDEDIENIENEVFELQQEESSGKTVFITPTGKKYHKESCRFANKNSVEVSIEKIR